MESGSGALDCVTMGERDGSCVLWWLSMVKGWDWRREEERESGVER